MSDETPPVVPMLRALLERYGQFDEATAQRIASIVSAWMDHTTPELEAAFGPCESPMERMFLLGLLWMYGVGKTEWSCEACIFSRKSREYILSPQFEEIDWEDQDESAPEAVPFARVDFMLRARGSDWSLAIEIDGHEFHEKTKEQAARDKLRDRRLVRAGRRVVRFSGSEVFADPKGCWAEVFGICDALDAEEEARVRFIRHELLEEMTAPTSAPRLPSPAIVDATEVAAE
jgi:hypothetical protein